MQFKDPFSKTSKRKQETDKLSEEVTGNKPKPGTRLIIKEKKETEKPKDDVRPKKSRY